ncbi:MAG: putative outer membrane protein pmp6 precursor [Lentisphaerae bacterium ADurb.Bin242]|nr:MAG: putative outer membrane protein pmp6 precursor [Lentisphaerae bacterium ADurb.Bin242]
MTVNSGSIQGGTASNQGGGIYGDNSTFTLKNATVRDNNADEGAGVYLAGGVLSTTGTSFINNIAANNGGAVYNAGAAITLQNSTFTNNIATAGNGGAIYNAGGTLSVTGGAFTGNNAENGGAIYNNAGGNLSGSTFTNNIAANNGGAVYNAGGNLSLGGTFTGNNAVNGGAVYNAAGNLTVSGTFTGNTAATNGGAVYNAGGTLSVKNGTFTGNTATGNGGAVYNTAQALSVSGSSFSGNTAANGGAIYTSGTSATIFAGFTGNSAETDGGAIYNDGSSVTIAGSFSNNAAAVNGGAIYNTGTMNITGGFSGNTARDGAALYNTGSADLLNFTVVSNIASSGAIITSNGVGSELYMNTGSMRNNTGTYLVDTEGHAAMLTVTTVLNATTSSIVNAASLDLVNSTITGATTDGAALIGAATALQIANSIVVSYSAGTTAVDATGAGKFYTAYSIFSGNAAQLANASVNVENLTGYNFAAVFGGGQVNAFGQLVIPNDSPAAIGVWTTYNRATGDIHYSTRPEGVWTVGYNVNRVAWNYLGPGNKMSTFSLSNLVGSSGHPSIGAYWLNSASSLPDFGPGINSDFANPSYNGMIMDWGYNSVIDAFMAGSDLYLTLNGELPMGWMGSLSRELFGAPYSEMDTFSVMGGRGDLGGVPGGEYGLGMSINGSPSDDFTRFEETPYHSDGTPLTDEELELIRDAAVKGVAEEELLTLNETIGEKVLSALRSADIFKDSFDKALDQLLGADA